MTEKPEDVDFHAFHERDLPARLRGRNGALAGKASKHLAPIAFQVGSSAYSYVPRVNTVDIERGVVTEAAIVVELAPAAWRAFMLEHQTAPGLIYAGAVKFNRGDVTGLMHWEPAIRAMMQGRPAYDPNDLDLTGLGGEPLDLGKSWTLDSPSGELRNFFRKTGFLHLKNVFTPDEVGRLRAEVDRLRPLAKRGDRRSWWAKDSAGQEQLVRITYCGERSTFIASLLDDPRMRAIAALSGEVLAPVYDRADGQSVLFKIPRAVEGLADLGWHVDCGLGMHPVLCPSINIGIQLSPGNRESGLLKMVPGTHLCSCELIADPTQDVPGHFPVVGLTTEAGDCTAHFGHILHAAPPPEGNGGRMTLYIGFANPDLLKLLAPGEGPNDILFRPNDPVVPAMSTVA